MRIGVDWGGTHIKAAVVDGANVRTHAAADTNPATALDDIARLVDSLSPEPEQVGIAIPGEVRDDGRCWRLPNVPGFEGVNIAAELQRRIGCPVAVENDATTAALAERLFGWGNTYKSFLLVTLGTGVGGGLVLDGNLRRGRSGFAGEIGHVLVNSAPDAWLCGCGKRGCLEAYAGKAGLLRRYAESGGSASSVKQIAEIGGEGADDVWRQMGDALGSALGSINNTLDLDAIVFTGGISNSLHLIEPYIREALGGRAFAQPLADVPLKVSQLGEHAGVIGAAHLPTP
ncbi:MAG: ROK family protein [Planctomycetes bacterium]|nr:ROK family protein [Planctomycetota bacterium]MCW8136634.1 ROK family protein [Planctomycetota bacterium]